MIKIDKEKCIGCGACVWECPMEFISIKDGKAEMAEAFCIKCGHCFTVCPVNAIIVKGYKNEEYDEISDNKPVLDPEQLLYSMKCRRSIRKFTEKIKRGSDR